MGPLANTIALVAGATRGAGRGIARALGEAGATVYCTGRSTRDRAATEGRSETIEETAELVSAAGGVGIAVCVDHSVEAEVEALMSRVRAAHGGLDVLVNSIWGGDAAIQWGAPFWALDSDRGFATFDRAVKTHLLTSRHAAPLMLDRSAGLIVEVTDGDFHGYRGQLFYDLCKATVIRLAYAMSMELREHPVTALAITPGFMRSEAMLDHFGVSEADWREGIATDPHFAASETPLFVGRAVAALAGDSDVRRFRGQVLSSWGMARHYQFDDADGRRPDWGAHIDGVVVAAINDDTHDAEALDLIRTRYQQLHRDPDSRELATRIEAFAARRGLALL